MAVDRQGKCPLCGRVLALTFHHLIPRKLHRRARFKKQYSRADLNKGVFICRLCHDGLHDRYDEMTLANQFATVEQIKANPAIQRHAEWVAKQKIRF